MDERSLQLEAFSALARLDVESSASLRTFLPLFRHVWALSADILIVLGARGSGKTALFKLVRDAGSAGKLRAFLGNQRIPDALWIDAFSQDNRNHPDVGVMEQFGVGAGDIALRAFWVAHLLRVARQEVQGLSPLPDIVQSIIAAPPNDLSTWVPMAEANLGPVFTALDAIDKHLASEGRTVVALYDYLDRIAQFTPDVRRRYVRSLLSLWLSLSNRYKQLLGKIFLRDDLFQASEIDFTDANKLRGRAEKLEWDAESLYRVVIRQVLNLRDDRGTAAVRELLAEVPGLQVDDLGEFGLMPAKMSEDTYKAFVSRVAGKVIGRGVAKGATHAWILGRLNDAHQRITPRAVMWMFGYAAEAAIARPPGRNKALLSASDLLKALRRTSKDRALEVLEEDKLAKRLENLRGQKIPFARADIVKLLSIRRNDEEPGIPEHGESVLKELLRLGLLREDENGKIDVPDIYRYGFEIGPDYATAWSDLLEGNELAAKNQFIREAPELALILKKLNVTWNEIGKDELGRGDIAGARIKCERALQGAQSTGDLLAEADAWNRLAEIDHIHLKNYGRAKIEYLRALSLIERSQDAVRELETRWSLALSEDYLKNFEAARGQFFTCVELARRTGNFGYLAIGSWGLALIAERQGRTEDAQQDYLRFLLYAQRGADSWAESSAWEDLSRLAASREKTAMAIQFSIFAKKPYNGSTDGFDLDKLRQEALAEYERDKGHSLLQKAFPEVDLSSLIED